MASETWSGGRLRGRALGLPIGAPVRIVAILDDLGTQVFDLTHATFQGQFPGTNYFRIRIDKRDPRFLRQNVADNPDRVLELAVPGDRVERRKAWFRVSENP